MLMPRISLNRRAVLLALPAGLLLPQGALAADFIGEAADVRGTVVARQSAGTRNLLTGAGLLLKDSTSTVAVKLEKA